MRRGPYASRLIGRAGLVAVPVAVLLAACGSPQPETQPQTPAGSVATGGPASTLNPVADPAATVFASPSPSPSVVSAFDHPDACRNADCEVAVRQGDRLRLDPKTGLDEITIVGLDQGEVRVRFEAGAGAFHVEGMNTGVSQSCFNGRCHTEGGLTLAMGRPGRIGDIRLRLASVAPDHAVLVLSPA
ncbi:hypothetical protein FLW53_18935 [Microbispora sp. SCL1-1]|uniref:DUF3060 domain-containing protein n=1 Tax=Microbispora hainanensis TaxID=568844 RepID=A0ABZ1SQS7_9ACTN|nr:MULTISPECIES: hypothetical protein [Microbispora]NJP26240.1 hypothetical protein [Microbispora sp. CL1-1]TQS12663.1 hypothetical protein FLW53_18935 [Microbispora sp. SCL1-1]